MTAINPSHFNECMSNVYWITGLSAAGKTTLAGLLTDYLRDQGEQVIMLDGDELRYALDVTTNHNRKDRLDLAFKYSRLARMLAIQKINVVVSTVSLFKEIHIWNRRNLPGYIEIYLKIPIEELRRRDPKKIYKRFYAGKIINVAGLDIPIDEPESPDLLIEYSSELSKIQTLNIVIKELINKEFGKND
jgi:cytidine diphosphoramidate kinase